MPLELTTPAHERLVAELLAWDEPRPTVDPALAPRLRAFLEDGLAEVAARIPAGEGVYVGKWSLDALVCDGWYRARQDEPFRWSVAAARGKLAHRAIEVDWKLRRSHEAGVVVDHAWGELASDQRDDLAGFLNTVDEVGAAELRHDAAQLVTEFRDTWPTLPWSAAPRLEQAIRVRLADGRVTLSGTPDLVLGTVRDDRCRMLLVDFKTGRRKPQQERDELRFYALLSTLKYGVPPWRWGAYYVAEGAWDVEDLDPDALVAAARRVLAGVEQAVRLQIERAAEADWRLRGGAHCAWCARAATCPAYEPPRDAFDR